MDSTAACDVLIGADGTKSTVQIYYMLRKLTILGYEATTLETVLRAFTIYDKVKRSFSADVALRSVTMYLSGRRTFARTRRCND